MKESSHLGTFTDLYIWSNSARVASFQAALFALLIQNFLSSHLRLRLISCGTYEPLRSSLLGLDLDQTLLQLVGNLSYALKL